MGWREDLIRIGINAGIAASMGKDGKDRARKALNSAFPELEKVVIRDKQPEPETKGKGK